ncbi:substrate-binding periplasmic protein [Methylibium petroleiphilum]|uniref:substrate-binding periplasmic protein n=1 Tax=Methylibium petroleiphilum TaxID=105560 RepID=UPI001AC4017D|nr:transporter substrate-binding domain-containing protein [Methylibium petroleiphilum]MBN9202879.1 transporter substrate-binding domain-containing protein [Methylibium petroleiphilum]
MTTSLQTLALAVLMAVAGIAGAADAPASAALKVCVDQDDPPFAAEATPERGIDVEVAQALAKQLNRPLRLVWVQVPNRGGIGKALRQTLVAGQCDAYLGIPQGPDMAGELAERKLTQSGPYLLLGYVAVAAPGRPVPTTASLRRARKIGAVSATPADLYLHRMNLPRAPFPGSAALLAGLKSGEIDVALIWSPWLADDAAKGYVRGTESLGDADLVTGLTVATRRADEALTRDIAAAVDALRGEGRFDAIAQGHDLPKITPP